MSDKYAAFGAHLEVGTAQVETATVVIDAPTYLITTSGNAAVIVTAAGMAGTPITTQVAVLEDDTADDVAGKIIAALGAVGAITAMFSVFGSGPYVVLRRLIGAANDATLNISIADNTCEGITTAATSANTTAGVAKTEVAGVKNISGPGLGVDTEDVTTHDQATAFEENVATIIRSGEVTLDIVYDPADATHDAATGLVYRLEDKIFTYFDLMFMGGANNWTFFGYITGFEPTGDVAGALTASVKIKITGAPTLE